MKTDETFYRRYGKRCFDLLVTVPLLLALAPLLLAIGVLIRIKLGVPVLFRQQRPGCRGRLFRLLKFRTMLDTRDQHGNLLPDADRITRLGRVLRATSIDELPELWNVLTGEMSLVGPRPLLTRYLDRYSPRQARRHEVRPGVTGWAQVNGRNAISWDEKFERDVWYVEHCSFWLDLKILTLTLFRVLRRDGISHTGYATAPEFLGPGGVSTDACRNGRAPGDGILVLGGGGHAKVVISALQAAGHEVSAVYADDTTLHGRRIMGVPVCGSLDDLEGLAGCRAVIAVGDCAVRKAIADRFQFDWICAVHPTAWIHPSVLLGPGCVVCAGAIIQPDAVIGAHTIVNTAASVDHDCRVADFAHLGPGVRLAGHVTVGEQSFLGTASAALPGVTIGRGTTVGAGAVVVRNLPDAVVAVGCPARITRSTTTKTEHDRNAWCTLAIDGGPPVRSGAFSHWPLFDAEQIEAAASVLRSGKVNYWTGEEGRRFEDEFAAFTGTQYAIALANGTVALELALIALGIGPGDEVIVPCRTFIASASCVVMRGATPVVVDVDPESQNISCDAIAAHVTPRTKAVIAVHLAGRPCDMDPILELARTHGLSVIEDCAQAHGARYKGRPVGSLGDAAAFSFCQDKIMTTGGEGGMLVTGRADIWQRAWEFKDHGKSFDAVYRRRHPAGFRWLHESFGTNWRMTEMQAAIGRHQLALLPQWLETRRQHARILDEGCAGIPALRCLDTPQDIYHAYYKYYTFVRPERLQNGWDRDRIMAAVTAEGVPCFSGTCGEIYLEKAFDAGFRPLGRLPGARQLDETSLMFLVDPTLNRNKMQETCRAIQKVMHVASRPAAHTSDAARAA